MGKDLVPRDDDNPIALRRAAGRELSRIQESALLQRAQIDAREQNAAYKVDRRIENACVLASRTVQNAAQLNRQVTAVSRDNPGLEMALRNIEEDVLLGSRTIIYRYIIRP